MTRRDPLLAANAHVRAFAAANRLRLATRDDGEVVLLLGPPRSRPAPIGRDGRTFPLDCHASFGLRAGLWTIFAGPVSTRRVSAVAARWESLGLAPRALDFEAWVDVPEDRLLEVADAHPLTRPRRRRLDSPEVAAANRARLAEFRRRSVPSDAPWEGTSAVENRAAGSGTTSRPSAPGSGPGSCPQRGDRP